MGRSWLLYLMLSLLVLSGPLWSWLHPGVMAEKRELASPSLPLWPEVLSDAVGQEIVALNLWREHRGKEGAELQQASDKNADSRTWTLVGTGQTGGVNVAMIRVGREINMYFAGDLLPDGRKIVQVLLDGVLVDSDGEGTREYVYLFGKKGS